MIIKKMRIKNFRNIKNLELDFSANSAGSDLDLKRGNFVKSSNGKVIPQVIALIGPNAVGKTNILEAIKFLEYVLSDEINLKAIRRIILRTIENKANIDEKKLNEKIFKMLKRINNDELTIEEVEIFLDEKKNIISQLFLKQASNKDEAINIEITFWDIENKKELVTSILLDLVSIQSKIPKKLEKINNWVHVFNQTPFHIREAIHIAEIFSINSFNIMTKLTILKNLYKKIGADNLLNLINIADPNISSIFEKDHQIFLRSSASDFDINIDSLSSGTIRYIYIIAFIISNTKDKKGIFLIDEIELNLHRELTITLIQAMNLIVRFNKNITFIFTTHNPMIIGEVIKYKQVLEIKEDVKNNVHSATKLSTLFKSHESLEQKYKKGIISKFPASSYSFDNLYKVINA